MCALPKIHYFVSFLISQNLIIRHLVYFDALRQITGKFFKKRSTVFCHASTKTVVKERVLRYSNIPEYLQKFQIYKIWLLFKKRKLAKQCLDRKNILQRERDDLERIGIEVLKRLKNSGASFIFKFRQNKLLHYRELWEIRFLSKFSI